LKIKGHKTEESSAPAKLVLLEKLSESEGAKVNEHKAGLKETKDSHFCFLSMQEGDKKEEEKAKSTETASKEETKQPLAFSTK